MKRTSLRLTAPLALVALAVAPSALAQTGLVPLSELGSGTYSGFPGGLYPGGVNDPPAAHFADAMQRAGEVVPRNAAGNPDPQGLIGMIAVGMSNTTHEFGAFERNEDTNRNRNARLVLMDTAFGGQTAAIIASATAGYWTTMSQRLAAMGLTAAQVQVAWLKEADAGPPDDFPGHAVVLRDELELAVDNLHDKFPNLKLCYLSSRIYGGYAAPGSLNPEPQAYESGFSVKWLIEDQIAGDPGLNYGRIPGPVRAPLLLWGPYLWADGTTPRGDGLTWQVTDLESDHTHPSPSGEQKVAALLSAFFAAEATAAPWWPARADVGLVARDAAKDAHVSAGSPTTNFGAAATLLEQGGASPINPYVGFDVSGVARPVATAKLSLRVLDAGGGRVSVAADTSWGESTLTFANAPAAGAVLMNLPQSSRDGTIAANVTGSVNGDADGALTYVLTTPAAGLTSYHSRDGGDPPRLVMAVSCAASADGDGDGRADPCDCAPQDPTSFAIPGEVLNLRWLDRATLTWDSTSGASGAGTVHDVTSGDLVALPTFAPDPGDLCLGAQVTATSILDPGPDPATGQGRYFVARAENACGRSRWETSSDGRERVVAGCP
jgi:hypothetical protein